MKLMGEVVERRTATFPFTYIVDTYLEVHNECYVNFSDVRQGIIYITFDPKEFSTEEYDKILNWLISNVWFKGPFGGPYFFFLTKAIRGPQHLLKQGVC